MKDLEFLTIAEASKLIAGRKLSPVELTEAYLARIEALDHLLDSFVTLTAERARTEAKAAEATIMASGPVSRMHGIPYCLKDIFETAGIRTTAMSKLLADNVVSCFSLGPSDDEALSCAFVANGFRRTGLLQNHMVVGGERKDAIIWSRKLANPADE